MTNEVNNKLFAALVVQDIAFFDGTNTGQLTSRLANDASQMVNPMRTLLNTLLSPQPAAAPPPPPVSWPQTEREVGVHSVCRDLAGWHNLPSGGTSPILYAVPQRHSSLPSCLRAQQPRVLCGVAQTFRATHRPDAWPACRRLPPTSCCSSGAS